MLASLAQLGILLLATVMPLTDAERTALGAARDDRGYEDEAIAVLLTHAASWTTAPGIGDEAIRLTPDIAAMNADPARYRGDLCRIEGRLEQRTALGGGYAGTDEWFIRLSDGTPVVVYLPIDETMKPLRDGERVALNARFGKRMKYQARDGTMHTYAAFVGAQPWLVQTVSPWGGLWILAALVMILLVAFLVILAIVRRGGAARNTKTRFTQRDPVEAEAVMDATLPGDPAEALAELQRRRGASM